MTAMTGRFEAVIDLDTSTVDPWGFTVSSPSWPMRPTLLFMPSDVAEALSGPVQMVSRGRLQTLTVSCDGVATVVDSSTGQSFVYELFPAIFSDGRGPAIYVGVWPD